MQNNGIDVAKYRIKSILSFVVAIASGILSSMLYQLGLFLVPISSSFLAVLFYLEHYSGRRLSYVAPAVLIAADIIFTGFYSVNGLCAVLVALVMYLLSRSRKEKADCVIYCTAIIFAFFILSVMLGTFLLIGKNSINDALVFLGEKIEEFRAEFVRSVMEVYSSASSAAGQTPPLTADDFSALYDAAINMLVGYVAVIAFALCGVAVKLYCILGASFSSEDGFFREWRFMPSSVYGYFFIALVFLTMFIPPSGIFGLLLMNLYVVFMVVYAYLGCRMFVGMLAAKLGNKLAASIIVIIALTIFAAYAVQILSYFGVFSSISFNKRIANDKKDNQNRD